MVDKMAKDYELDNKIKYAETPKINRETVFKRLIELSQKVPPKAFALIKQYNVDILNKLNIGFIDKKTRTQIEYEYSSDVIKKLGINNFYNRVIIPYDDDYCSGRSLNKNIKNKNTFPKGIKKRGWYVQSNNETPKGLMVFEGETDLIAAKHLYEEEYDMLSLGGVNNNIYKEFPDFLRTRKVIICFDKDTAGFEGMNKFVKGIEEYDLEIYYCDWEEDKKDIDELWYEHKNNTKELITIKQFVKKDVYIEGGFEPVTKAEVKEVIDRNFPKLWDVYDICISTIAVLKLKDWSDPVGINLVGKPSGEKTTVLSFFYDFEPLVLKSDNFTPKSFVTHSTNVKKEELEDIDLLPKMKDKCFIVPELAPLFGKRKEDLLESIGTITRIFDGEGYESDSGSHGHRGYRGDYKFVWLGATTPPPKTVWNIMGNMGTRWFFCEIDNEEKDRSDKINIIMDNHDYSKRLKECKEITHRFLKTIFKDGLKRNLEWDNLQTDIEAAGLIIDCGDFLKKIRAAISVWITDTGEIEHESPLIEKPYRIFNVLKNLAKGHAITEGRDYISLKDIPPIVRVAFSSMPENRRNLFKLIIDTTERNVYSLDPEYVKDYLKCSLTTARKVLKTLETLDILESILVDTQKTVGHPVYHYRLNEEIRKILERLIPYYNQNNKNTKSATIEHYNG